MEAFVFEVHMYSTYAHVCILLTSGSRGESFEGSRFLSHGVSFQVGYEKLGTTILDSGIEYHHLGIGIQAAIHTLLGVSCPEHNGTYF